MQIPISAFAILCSRCSSGLEDCSFLGVIVIRCDDGTFLWGCNFLKSRNNYLSGNRLLGENLQAAYE